MVTLPSRRLSTVAVGLSFFFALESESVGETVVVSRCKDCRSFSARSYGEWYSASVIYEGTNNFGIFKFKNS